jgi:hypothetical protein
VKHKDGEVVKKGPYYILTSKTAGSKTASYRVPAKEAGHIRREVDNYRRFRSLSDEYAAVCDQLSRLIGTKQGGDPKKLNLRAKCNPEIQKFSSFGIDC